MRTSNVKQTLRNLDRVLATQSTQASAPVKVSVPVVAAAPPKPPVTEVAPEPIMSSYWKLAEVLNARLATAGQIAGPVVFQTTGMDLGAQLQDSECLAALFVTTTVVTSLTVATLPYLKHDNTAKQIETGLGQVAMLLWTSIVWSQV